MAFGYQGQNFWNCDPWIDSAMQPYLAWYNGTTSITHGGGDCNDTTVFKTLKNAFAIGGQTVPGNSSLDRSSYDKNPYYFWFPSASGADIALEVQSSSDAWYTELQHWELGASKRAMDMILRESSLANIPPAITSTGLGRTVVKAETSTPTLATRMAMNGDGLFQDMSHMRQLRSRLSTRSLKAVVSNS